MQHRERDIFLRLGKEAQEPLRHQRAHMVHEQLQLLEEGEAQINFVRHRMESEQRASLRILQSVSRERDLVRQEAYHLRDDYQRSERAALLPREEVEELIVLSSEAQKKTGEYFHDIHVRNLTESHPISPERDRALFEVGPFFENTEKRKHRRGVAGTNISQMKRKRWTLKASSKITLLGKTRQIKTISQ